MISWLQLELSHVWKVVVDHFADLWWNGDEADAIATILVGGCGWNRRCGAHAWSSDGFVVLYHLDCNDYDNWILLSRGKEKATRTTSMS